MPTSASKEGDQSCGYVFIVPCIIFNVKKSAQGSAIYEVAKYCSSPWDF